MGFCRKNLLTDDAWMEEWVSRVMAGLRDRRIRFNVYSFTPGFPFGDYTKDFQSIDIPTMFLAGTTGGSRTVKNRVKSVRPPALLVAVESSFSDQAQSRMEHRCAVMKNCQGVMVKGAGFDMFFEHTEKALPALKRFLASLD